jgi:hypothetical protein
VFPLFFWRQKTIRLFLEGSEMEGEAEGLAEATAAKDDEATTKGGDDENNEEEEDEDGDDASGATAMSGGSGEDESGSSESESETGDGEEEGAKRNSGKFDLMVSQELQHKNSHLFPAGLGERGREAGLRAIFSRSLAAPLCPPPRRPRPTT